MTFLAFLGILAVPAYAQSGPNSYPISNQCNDIISNSNSYYYLTQNVGTGCSNIPYTVSFTRYVSNTVLNCQGHEINYTASYPNGGSGSLNVSNDIGITVENCIFFYGDGLDGISIQSSSNVIVENSTATTNSLVPDLSGTVGMSSSTSENVIFKNDTADNMGVGIQTSYDSNDIIENDIADNTSSSGIYVYQSPNTLVTRNKAQINGIYGIQVVFSDNSIISNNTVDMSTDSGIAMLYSSNSIIANNTDQGNLDAGWEVVASNYTQALNNNFQGNAYAGIFNSYINLGSSIDGLYINNKLGSDGPLPYYGAIEPRFTPQVDYANVISYTASGNFTTQPGVQMTYYQYTGGLMRLSSVVQYIAISPIYNKTRAVMINGYVYTINQTSVTPGNNKNIAAVELTINKVPVTVSVGQTVTVNTLSLELVYGLENPSRFTGLWNSTFFEVKEAGNAVPPLSATITPSSTQTFSPGQSVLLTGSATGGTPPYSYQWYLGTNSICSSDSVVSGATSSTYSAAPTSGEYFCVKITDSESPAHQAYSPAVQVLPKSQALPVTVNIKPNKIVIKVGKSATVKSTVSGGVPPYSYSWSEEMSPSTTYVPISGCTVTSTKCIITNFAVGTYKIELVVTDALGNMGSAVPTNLQVLSKAAQVPAGVVNGTAANGNVTFVDVGNTTQVATPAQVPNNTSVTTVQQGSSQSIWGAIISFFQRLFGSI